MAPGTTSGSSHTLFPPFLSSVLGKIWDVKGLLKTGAARTEHMQLMAEVCDQ